MKALGLCLGAALSVATATTARASPREPVHAALEWHRLPGGESCIEATALERAVETRLGRTVFVGRSSADVVIVARIGPARSGPGWVVDLELRTAEGHVIGTRELTTTDSSCSALNPSLALVVALMIDIPKSQLPPRTVQRTPAPPLERPTPIRLPPERPPSHWRVEVKLTATTALGLLPGVAPGARLGWGFKPPGFFLTELDATLYAKSEVRSGSVGSRFSLVSAGLYICPVSLGTSGARLWGCLSGGLGLISSEGFGFARNLRQNRPLYSAGLQVRAAVPLAGPLELRGGLGFGVPLTRDRFTYRTTAGREIELFRIAPIFGGGELGLGLSF